MKNTWDASSGVRQALDHINTSWREKRFADLPRVLAENIVSKGPALTTIGWGRDALVKSYIDFMGKSVITAMTSRITGSTAKRVGPRDVCVRTSQR